MDNHDQKICGKCNKLNMNLDRYDLESLVKGSIPDFKDFNHDLIIKAGHRYSPQYGRTSWDSLSELTENELWKLYNICKDSWQ